MSTVSRARGADNPVPRSGPAKKGGRAADPLAERWAELALDGMFEPGLSARVFDILTDSVEEAFNDVLGLCRADLDSAEACRAAVAVVKACGLLREAREHLERGADVFNRKVAARKARKNRKTVKDGAA